MSTSWPATLPQDMLWNSYSEAYPDNVIRTAMDIGPPKSRKRSTAAPRPVKGRIYVTEAQRVIFETFMAAINQGASAFTWKDMKTGGQKDYKFVSAPKYTPAGRSGGAVTWFIDLDLIMLP